MGFFIVLLAVCVLIALCIKDLIPPKKQEGGCDGASCSGCAGCNSSDSEIIVTVKRPKEDD
jgi:hypothetical protein